LAGPEGRAVVISCGCGKRQDEALAGTTLRMSTAVENSAGLYDISSFPDCDTPYHGAFAKSNVTVYVVDINGPNEQFFLKSQRNEAARIARTQKLTLAHLRPNNICHDAMVGLFGA
jgi:hypothetical protein